MQDFFFDVQTEQTSIKLDPSPNQKHLCLHGIQ